MRSTWTSKWTPGQKAPQFSAVAHDGSLLNNETLLGSPFIMFFYNHDGSETCTKEVCNMRDHFNELSQSGYKVIGVSQDKTNKHTKFAVKYGVPFPLIGDDQNELSKSFDIFGPKLFMGRTSDTVHRTTFIIDENGLIKAVIHPVDSASHAQQILKAVGTVA